ncbi:Olfactory receptor 5B12, partial [Clarias magur]
CLRAICPPSHILLGVLTDMCSCVGMGHGAVLASSSEAIWDAGSERQCGKTLMS